MATVFVLILAAIIPIDDAADTNYYVFANGSDSNGDGSMSNPWATIQSAQSNVQKRIASLSKSSFIGNITVHIDGSSGSYQGPLTINPIDSMSGFTNNNFVIQSDPLHIT